MDRTGAKIRRIESYLIEVSDISRKKKKKTRTVWDRLGSDRVHLV